MYQKSSKFEKGECHCISQSQCDCGTTWKECEPPNIDRSPSPQEVEMLKNGYTWYGMWTCQYWQIVYRRPTTRQKIDWAFEYAAEKRDRDEFNSRFSRWLAKHPEKVNGKDNGILDYYRELR